ncbi:MAG: hypothetical protein J6U75_04210 [Clostridia bacterium]|nr:hypothetical protein [Clostridia bacterium]
MARLDKFLCDNRKYFDNADKAEEPSFVILTGDTPDEEILEEVRKYREKHKNVCVAIYDRSPADNSESVKYQSDQK